MALLRNYLLHLLITSLLLIVVAGYFSGFYLDGIGAAFLASFVLSLMNVVVKPFLILLTLPVTVLTLGFFLIVINAITLMLTASLMGSAFVIESFSTALIAAIFLGLLNLMIDKVIIEPLMKRR